MHEIIPRIMEGKSMSNYQERERHEDKNTGS